MEKDLIQTCMEYLEAAESIRKSEIISVMDLTRRLNITFVTWKRIQNNPETCSLKTLRKIKKFVDGWSN